MKSYKRIRRLVPGDKLLLSDTITQLQYQTCSKEFIIENVRYYGIHVGYLSTDENGLNYMVLVSPQVHDNKYQIFYMDISGATSDDVLSEIVTKDKEDLSDKFQATIEFHGKVFSVTWTKVIESINKYAIGLIKKWVWTLYNTTDENAGNNICLVDWKTTGIDGVIEVWYGKEVLEEEISYVRKAKQDL